jgi:Flp pilus assembly secretin CpaC
VFAFKIVPSLATAAIIVAAELATPVHAQSISFLSLQSGHSTVVSAEGLTRAAVGDGRVAGVVAIGSSQVVINAKEAGHTTVTLWMAGGVRENYEVTVTQQQGDDLARIMRTAINDRYECWTFDHRRRYVQRSDAIGEDRYDDRTFPRCGESR